MNYFQVTASRQIVRDGERGTILVLVLWVVLAISLLAVSFSASIRTEVDAARNLVEQKQSYYMARAGIEYAAYKIMETQSAFYQSQQMADLGFEAIPDVLKGSVSLQLADGGADVKITDESGKINVNLAPPHLIFNLLLMIGVPSDQADIITDSILDWIDPDDLVRSFGAESDYYQGLEEPYAARNGFFEVPEELMLVQGITPEIYYGRKGLSDSGDPIELYGLQNYMTTFSNLNRIDVNSAPVPVLASIPGLDFSTALMIEAMRTQGPLTDIGQVAEAIPGLSGEVMGFLGVFKTNIYSLNSYGRVNNSKVTSRIRAVIRFDGSGSKGYSVLYWNESNVEL